MRKLFKKQHEFLTGKIVLYYSNKTNKRYNTNTVVLTELHTIAKFLHQT